MDYSLFQNLKETSSEICFNFDYDKKTDIPIKLDYDLIDDAEFENNIYYIKAVDYAIARILEKKYKNENLFLNDPKRSYTFKLDCHFSHDLYVYLFMRVEQSKKFVLFSIEMNTGDFQNQIPVPMIYNIRAFNFEKDFQNKKLFIPFINNYFKNNTENRNLRDYYVYKIDSAKYIKYFGLINEHFVLEICAENSYQIKTKIILAISVKIKENIPSFKVIHYKTTDSELLPQNEINRCKYELKLENKFNQNICFYDKNGVKIPIKEFLESKHFAPIYSSILSTISDSQVLRNYTLEDRIIFNYIEKVKNQKKFFKIEYFVPRLNLENEYLFFYCEILIQNSTAKLMLLKCFNFEKETKPYGSVIREALANYDSSLKLNECEYIKNIKSNGMINKEVGYAKIKVFNSQKKIEERILFFYRNFLGKYVTSFSHELVKKPLERDVFKINRDGLYTKKHLKDSQILKEVLLFIEIQNLVSKPQFENSLSDCFASLYFNSLQSTAKVDFVVAFEDHFSSIKLKLKLNFLENPPHPSIYFYSSKQKPLEQRNSLIKSQEVVKLIEKSSNEKLENKNIIEVLSLHSTRSIHAVKFTYFCQNLDKLGYGVITYKEKNNERFFINCYLSDELEIFKNRDLKIQFNGRDLHSLLLDINFSESLNIDEKTMVGRFSFMSEKGKKIASKYFNFIRSKIKEKFPKIEFHKNNDNHVVHSSISIYSDSTIVSSHIILIELENNYFITNEISVKMLNLEEMGNIFQMKSQLLYDIDPLEYPKIEIIDNLLSSQNNFNEPVEIIKIYKSSIKNSIVDFIDIYKVDLRLPKEKTTKILFFAETNQYQLKVLKYY